MNLVQSSFQENLAEDNVSLEVQTVAEVDVVECENEGKRFETALTLQVSGDLTDLEISFVARSFGATYSNLGGLFCDPLFRQITSSVPDGIDVVRKNRNLQTGCIDLEIRFVVDGTCMACEDTEPLFDRPNVPTRRNLKSAFHSTKTISAMPWSPFPDNCGLHLERRRLQGSDICFCEGETIDDRAVSKDEFFDVYQVEVNGLPNLCALVGLIFSGKTIMSLRTLPYCRPYT